MFVLFALYRADPQFSTTPGSMKTATKFPPIPDRALCTLRFVQAGFDCHIVQAATAIQHKAKEAGRSLGEQSRSPASSITRSEVASRRFWPASWPTPSSVRCGCAAVVRERPGKGKADAKGERCAIRDAQTKDGWRLRAADLNDIDGLHALAASPLVYRYLFDGARRIRNISRAGLHRVLPTQERRGSVCGSWKMFPRDTPVVSSCDPIHPPDPQNSPTYWTLAIGDRDLP